MDTFQFCALIVAGLIAVALLRQYHPVFAILASVAIVMCLIVLAIQLVLPLQSFFEKHYSFLDSSIFTLIIKMIGVGILVQTTADLCKEAAQTALENKVILIGKLLIITLALPVFEKILDMLSELLL